MYSFINVGLGLGQLKDWKWIESCPIKGLEVDRWLRHVGRDSMQNFQVNLRVLEAFVWKENNVNGHILCGGFGMPMNIFVDRV